MTLKVRQKVTHSESRTTLNIAIIKVARRQIGIFSKYVVRFQKYNPYFWKLQGKFYNSSLVNSEDRCLFKCQMGGVGCPIVLLSLFSCYRFNDLTNFNRTVYTYYLLIQRKVQEDSAQNSQTICRYSWRYFFFLFFFNLSSNLTKLCTIITFKENML